ncbi:hypothetical protein SCLCIDRAFT_1192822 [Scleroderma citrinum Foug A]|uniref:Uncharacterized protein n=1 Tax=Scleroderma citrinum Foug A TaxID=1036808 RepID=A0A0C3DAN6_9AGAM|nr:hypothetical protein SCLCIDRAFT_1192822 [Scleroderma citrinum Foug A]
MDPQYFGEDLSSYTTIGNPAFPLPVDMQDTLGGNADLQSTIADISNTFQGYMDAATNSIPSDRVKAWSFLCQEQLTPQSASYWKVEIKRLYIEYLSYPTVFELVCVNIVKKGTNRQTTTALNNETFVGLIIDMLTHESR